MGIDLFSLRMNIETTGVNNAVSELKTIEATGKQAEAALARTTSASLNGAKGFRDLSGAYANQDAVLAAILPKQEAVNEKLEKGTKAAKEHENTIGGLWHTVKALGEAWLVFEAIDFAKDAIEDAAALHELSQKTGATVEMLSILEFAGKRANVSSGDLAMGFRGLSLALGNLRDGQDKTVEAFKKIGLSFADFAGLSTDEAFKKIVVALGQLPDGLEKSEVAARVFGRSGAMLIPLLDDLAHQGFQAVTREAEKFHAVIGEKLADDADKLKDKTGDLKFEFQALARVVIPPLNTAMAALAEQLSEGPKDFWRNSMRELAAAADALTFSMFHLQDRFRGSTGANWELNDTGISPKGGGQRNRGQGLNNVALSDEEKDRVKEDIRAAKEAAAQHRREMLAIISSWADAPKDLGSPLAGGPIGLKGSAASEIAGLEGTAGRGRGANTDEDLFFRSSSFDSRSFFGKGAVGADGKSAMDRWKQDVLSSATSVRNTFETMGRDLGMTLANGFSAALGAALHGKNPFKAFGNVVLAGLGSIMQQMGSALMAYGVTMLKLLPFLTNIFTSGPAAIAAGIALTALGATLGGLATGGGSGGGGGGSAPKDTVTQIHLTANGAGGFTAPKSSGGDTFNIFGANDPAVHRQLSETVKNGRRSGYKY